MESHSYLQNHGFNLKMCQRIYSWQSYAWVAHNYNRQLLGHKNDTSGLFNVNSDVQPKREVRIAPQLDYHGPQ